MNEKIQKKTAAVSAALYSDIKNKRTHTAQNIVHKIIFGFGIRPFVRSQGAAYDGVNKKWESMGIKA